MDLITQTFVTCFSYQRKTFVHCKARFTVSFRPVERKRGARIKSPPLPPRGLLPTSPLRKLFPIPRSPKSLSHLPATPRETDLSIPPCFCFRRVYGNFQCVPSLVDRRRGRGDEASPRDGKGEGSAFFIQGINLPLFPLIFPPSFLSFVYGTVTIGGTTTTTIRSKADGKKREKEEEKKITKDRSRFVYFPR